MSKFKWMAIGKVGNWTDKNNTKVNIDDKYLDEVIANTNPEDVRFVIEHPKYNKIGFGKISALKRVGDLLFALPKEVNEDFKEAVNKGELPNRSMTIRKSNKKLLDISFLPPEIEPAIEGLGSYSFSSALKDDNLDVLILQDQLKNNESHFANVNNEKIEFAQYEISSYPFRTIKSLFRNLKDFFIEEFGLEKANKILDNWAIDEVGNAPSLWEKSQTQLANSFSKNNLEEKMDLSKIDLSKVDENIKAAFEALSNENQKLKTDYDAKVIELQSAQSTITRAEKEKIEAEVLQFCTSERITKKILPADQKKAIKFLTAQKEKGVLEFSVADGKQESFDCYEFAKELIEKLPDTITTEEFAKASITAEQSNLTDAQKIGKEIADFVNR